MLKFVDDKAKLQEVASELFKVLYRCEKKHGFKIIL